MQSEKPLTEFSGKPHTVPNSQQAQFPHPPTPTHTPTIELTKWKVNFTSNDCTSVFNVPFATKHHSTYTVSAFEKLSIASEAFLGEEASMSRNNVVECVEVLKPDWN